MGNKAKTRYLTAFGATDRELLAVRELTNGDLCILLRSGLNYEMNGDSIGLIEDRIQVHVSLSSTGSLIKRTTRLANGRSITSTVFAKNSAHSGLLVPIAAKRCSSLSHSAYNTKTSAKDSLVFVTPSYKNGPEFSLVWSLLVGEPQRVYPHVEFAAPFQKTFRCFSVCMYVNFLNFFSTDTSDFLFLATSAPRVDSKAVDGYEDFSSDGLENLDNEYISSFIFDANQLLAQRYIRRIADSAGEAEALRRLPQKPIFTLKPYNEGAVVLRPRPLGPYLGFPGSPKE